MTGATSSPNILSPQEMKGRVANQYIGALTSIFRSTRVADLDFNSVERQMATILEWSFDLASLATLIETMANDEEVLADSDLARHVEKLVGRYEALYSDRVSGSVGASPLIGDDLEPNQLEAAPLTPAEVDDLAPTLDRVAAVDRVVAEPVVRQLAEGATQALRADWFSPDVADRITDWVEVLTSWSDGAAGDDEVLPASQGIMSAIAARLTDPKDKEIACEIVGSAEFDQGNPEAALERLNAVAKVLERSGADLDD